MYGKMTWLSKISNADGIRVAYLLEIWESVLESFTKENNQLF